MNDRSLEALLTRTAASVVYPATPELSARVVAAVPVPRSRVRFAMRPAFGLVLAAALVLVAALAIAPSRDAVARLFGVEGSKIEFLPTPLPGVTATPFPTARPSPGPRGIAPVDIERLPELAGFEAILPDVEDSRLNSTLTFYADQAVVMHHYVRFDLWQTRLEQSAGFGKGVRPDGTVEEVEVADVPAVWLTGAEHFVYYYDSAGIAYAGSQRTIDRSTLIWRTDAFFYRIETNLALEEALRIAVTLP